MSKYINWEDVQETKKRKKKKRKETYIQNKRPWQSHNGILGNETMR